MKFDASAVRRRNDDTAEAIASVVSLRSVRPRHRGSKSTREERG